jgi:hypothetical protein
MLATGRDCRGRDAAASEGRGFSGQAILADYPVPIAFNFRRVRKVRLRSILLAMVASRHLLVEIEAYYLLPRSGRTRPRDDGASDSRLFPGYVLCFPVSKREISRFDGC